MKKGLVIALVIACWAARGQQTLDTATVKARRVIVTPRIDGFSFDARQARPAAGETATDLLSRLPGVQIDQQGSPIIRGSGQIKLFIDGRPAESYASTVAEALRLISADNIARVEVITHPSARYDAEGVDAVINIFTKKQLTDGVSGSANAQIANRTTEYQVRAAWRKHHWMVNTEGGRYAYHYNSYSLLNRADPGAHLLQTQDYDERNHNEYASTTVTWTPDTLITLNLGYRYSQGHGRSLTNLDNAFSEGDTSTSAYSTFTNSINQRQLHTLNWGLFGSTRNRSLKYELMASWFGQTRATNYTQTGNGPVQTSHNDIDNRELALQGDLTKKLGPQMTIETGVKSTFRQFHNQNLLSPDSTRSNRFFFRRSIIAFFLSYTVDLGKWKIRLGGRYEQTHWPLHFADTALTPPDYKNFIPDLTLSYIPAPGHTLSAGYSRKLIRPYIDNLNPVVNYLDSLNITYGNPALRPAYSDNYELNYNYRKSAWLLTTTLFLRRTSQSIENIRLLQSGGVVASTYANIAKNSILGLT
ncbi:MAG TPA: TonB-dependent receptor, partial [Puia sp.]